MQTDQQLDDQLSREVNGKVYEDEGFYVEYAGSDGQIKTMALEAEDYASALFEAVNLLCEQL